MAELRISDDPAALDLDVVHGFLSRHAYWCQGIPRELLAKALVAAAMAHPEVRGLRRIMLATRDAHALYAGFGFGPPARPEALMEIHRPGLYTPG